MSEEPLEKIFKKCIEELKDREGCEFMYRVFKIVDRLKLEECIAKHDIDMCYDKCIKECKDSDCDRLCDHAVGHAAASIVAREVLLEAARMAVNIGTDLLNALVLRFMTMLDKFAGRAGSCREKKRVVYLFSTIAAELMELTGVKELVLLMAPVLALWRECPGSEIDDVLEVVKIIAGENYAARIAAALEEGAVRIGNVVIRFPPVEDRKV